MELFTPLLKSYLCKLVTLSIYVDCCHLICDDQWPLVVKAIACIMEATVGDGINCQLKDLSLMVRGHGYHLPGNQLQKNYSSLSPYLLPVSSNGSPPHYQRLGALELNGGSFLL